MSGCTRRRSSRLGLVSFRGALWTQVMDLFAWDHTAEFKHLNAQTQHPFLTRSANDFCTGDSPQAA